MRHTWSGLRRATSVISLRRVKPNHDRVSRGGELRGLDDPAFAVISTNVWAATPTVPGCQQGGLDDDASVSLRRASLNR